MLAPRSRRPASASTTARRACTSGRPRGEDAWATVAALAELGILVAPGTSTAPELASTCGSRSPRPTSASPRPRAAAWRHSPSNLPALLADATVDVSRAIGCRRERRCCDDPKATLHFPGGTRRVSRSSGAWTARRASTSRSFTKQTGFTTLDHGFVNTAATKSAITYIDGDAGILRYRGYPIEDVARELHLPRGRLAAHLRRAADRRPNSPSSTRRCAATRCCTKTCRRFFDALPHDAHPMSVLSQRGLGAVDLLRGLARARTTPSRSSSRTIRLLAKLPVIAAYAHKKSLGQAFLYPDNSLSFVDNFLKLNFGTMAEPYEVNPVLVEGARAPADPARGPRAERLDLDGAPGRLDRGQHVRLDLGRHQRPLRPAARRRERGRARRCSARSATRARACEQFVERVKNKEDGVRLMGFGHRVYKNFDPRAKLVKESADEVLEALGVQDDAARHRQGARGGRARRRLLHRAQALPERRLLHRRDLQGDGLPDAHVHGAVRDRPPARLDRPLARDERRPGDQDRPPAAALRRLARARLARSR